MKRKWMVAVVGATALGCGEIVEVPVASTSETEATAGSGSSEGQTDAPSGDEQGTETTAVSTGGDTALPDHDSVSSSGAADSSGGSGPSTMLPFCHESENATEVPEDGSWLEAAIDVPAREDASTLGVSVRLAHRRVSDLRIRLRAPDGTLASLLDEPSCDGPNVDARFEDGAAQLGNEQCTEDGTSAIQGTVAALDELAPLLRGSVDGTWTLEVSDAVPGERGTLDDACVVLTVEGR